MAQKLQKQIPLHMVADITGSLGFITMRGTKHSETNYIIPDRELLAERRAQFGKDDLAQSGKLGIKPGKNTICPNPACYRDIFVHYIK